MKMTVTAILLLLALAVGCVVCFDSLFIDIGAAIVITLIALLLPLHFVCRGRERPK